MIAKVNRRNDYYAFGSPMPGRNYTSSSYRYGMNGQEKDDEIAGNGNIYTAQYWEYDSRLGRRWNRDPIRKHWESPYACFNNSPISIADPLGLDGESRAKKHAEKTGGRVEKGEKGNWWVTSGFTGKDKDGNQESGVQTKEFKDNGWDKFSKAVVGALKSADNWVNSKKGGAMGGREWEGLDGPFHSAEAGVKVEAQYGLVQVTADAHITEATSAKLDKSAEFNVNMLATNPKNIDKAKVDFSANAYMKYNVNRPDNSGIEINQKVSFRNIYIQLNWQLSGFQGFEIGVTTDKVPFKENKIGEGSMNVMKYDKDGVTFPVFNQNNLKN